VVPAPRDACGDQDFGDGAQRGLGDDPPHDQDEHVAEGRARQGGSTNPFQDADKRGKKIGGHGGSGQLSGKTTLPRQTVPVYFFRS